MTVPALTQYLAALEKREAIMLRVGLFGRGLATVVIVGALSFGMPVATAQADTNLGGLLTITAGSALGGGVGVAAAAPELATGAVASGFACAAALPVCAAVAAGVVGATLYMTHDTWIPWFQNGAAFLNDLGQPTWSQGSGYHVRVSDIPQNFGNWLAFDVQRDAGGSPGTLIGLDLAGTASCRQGDGTIIIRNYGMQHTFIVPDSAGGYAGYWRSDWAWPSPDTLSAVGASVCNGGETVIGFSGMGNRGVAGDITWGTMLVASAPKQISAEVQCQNPDGSSFAVTAAIPLPNDLVKIPTCTGAAGDLGGAHGKCVTLSGGAPGAMVTQSSDCAAATAAQALYPNCVGVSPACTYVVRLDGVPCVVGGPCSSWATIYSLDPARVRCMYGAYSVPVSNCAMLERVYETGTVLATGANTDGRPGTFTAPGPAGQVVGSTPPVADPIPLPPPTTVPDPSSAPDCLGTTYGTFNPVQWVLMPIKCAMIWAWVPDAGTVGPAVNDFQTVFKSKPPGSLIVGASTVFGSIGSGWNGGCSGAASASFSQPALGHPLQLPCTPSGGGGGSLPYTAMQIALIVATMIYVWHMVAAGISAQATGAGD